MWVGKGRQGGGDGGVGGSVGNEGFVWRSLGVVMSVLGWNYPEVAQTLSTTIGPTIYVRREG